MDHPYIKFWPRDWQGNKKLALCSANARGVWIEMLCIMGQAPRRGYLEVHEGRALSDEEAASLCRYRIRDYLAGKEELAAREVFSVELGTGVIYSRRMVRDEAKRVKGRMDGALGGNPVLVGAKPVDNPSPRTPLPTGIHTVGHSHRSIASAMGQPPPLSSPDNQGGYPSRGRKSRFSWENCKSTLGNPASNPVEIALQICSETESDRMRNYLSNVRKAVGEVAFRQEIVAFAAELAAGEAVKNRGAALVARLKKLGVGK